VREAAQAVDVEARLLAALPADFPRWSPLAQDQYLEVHTLLSGYLLASQGDRMLMGHSVEGRFPFLDAQVVELANALPPAHKLRGLDEKHVLKRAAAGLVPEEVLRRPKQPYRAPDALSFVGDGAPAWIGEVLSPAAVAAAGVFEPRAVERLWRKCQASGGGEQFSNADNMALCGVLSTGLLHAQLVRDAPRRLTDGAYRTVVDRILAPPGASPGAARTREGRE
jgi:asparagine synthase (glutamine-hydrolysing)